MRLYLTRNTCSISKSEWAVQILTSCFECKFHYLLVIRLLKTSSFHVMALIPPQPIYVPKAYTCIWYTLVFCLSFIPNLYVFLCLCVFYDNSFILHRWTIKSFSIWQLQSSHLFRIKFRNFLHTINLLTLIEKCYD